MKGRGAAASCGRRTPGNRRGAEERKNEEEGDGKEEGGAQIIYIKGEGAFGFLELGDSPMICSPNLP